MAYIEIDKDIAFPVSWLRKLVLDDGSPYYQAISLLALGVGHYMDCQNSVSYNFKVYDTEIVYTRKYLVNKLNTNYISIKNALVYLQSSGYIEFAEQTSIEHTHYGYDDDSEIQTKEIVVVLIMDKIKMIGLFGKGGDNKKNRRKTMPFGLRLKIFRRDDFRCVICGSQDYLTLDHIIPIFKGGQNTEDNLRVLCQSCNSKKGIK